MKQVLFPKHCYNLTGCRCGYIRCVGFAGCECIGIAGSDLFYLTESGLIDLGPGLGSGLIDLGLIISFLRQPLLFQSNLEGAC